MATIVMNRVGAGQNVIHGVGDGGTEKVVVASYDWTVAQASGTVFASPIVQSGCVITGVKVIPTGLGSATFSVGDAASATRYGTGLTAFATSQARPFTQTVSGPVLITTAAAATGATGSVDIEVYFLSRNNG